ncbi:MAG: ribonuclease HI [Endomicrobium sp.]|nr:ribonuclease HI [Endomicrobium sp.]
MSKIHIYTDGSCLGNPGRGGWAAIIVRGENIVEISGCEEFTTNQRMELLAAVKALASVEEKSRIILYSDSAYLINAFTKGWIAKWRKNGWITVQKKSVINIDLWERLVELDSFHDISWIKVVGHSTNEYNNKCDKLAKIAAARG